MEENTPASGTELSLSAALLAPLNTIFEAQIHAARSFLSFVLQMGFRHKYSRKEIEEMEKEPEENEQILSEINNEKQDRETINELREQQRSNGKLSDEDSKKLRRLLNKWDDFRSIDFTYVDDYGNEHEIAIPNIALIPVKPLAIDTASFKFELAVKHNRDFNTLRKSTKAESARPWYLIEPKQLTGNIVSKEEATRQAAISIEINIKSTEMPAGLNKLIATLNESSRIIPKTV